MTKAFIIFFLSSTVALAGTVHFDPPSATITPGTPSVSFEVSVSWGTLATIDSVDVIIVTELGNNLTFSFAQSFVDSTTIPPAVEEDTYWCGVAGCLYDDVSFGGNNFSTIPWNSPLLIGTLTVDTRNLQSNDGIELISDPEQILGVGPISLVASGVNQEILSGSTSITVVPEPATMGLMVVAVTIPSAWR